MKGGKGRRGEKKEEGAGGVSGSAEVCEEELGQGAESDEFVSRPCRGGGS